MRSVMRFVVVALLAAFSFPAVSQAKSGPGAAPIGDVNAGPLRAPAERSDSSSAAPSSGSSSEASLADLAAREQQAKELADFKGGGVYIYAGSGALLVVVVVLLVLLI